MGHDGEELVLHVAAALRFGQLLGLFVVQALVPGQVAGDLHIAAQAAALEQGNFTAAVETAAILAHVPAFVLAALIQARALQFALRHTVLAVFLGKDQLIMAAEHFVLGVAENQRGPGVPVGDQAMLVEQDDGEVVGALGHQAHAFFTQAHTLFRCVALADVDEGQHGAVDLLLAGPIRQQARQVPALVVAADLALDDGLALGHGAGVVGQRRIIQAMGDVEQGAAGVDRQHVEQVGGTRGEPADMQVAVDEYRGDLGRRDKVAQVVVDLVGFLDLVLELIVDRQQLFVDRLQLFLAGFQLFAGRAQLFVDRLHLFVGGGQLLAGNL
ncbi:hypothetical protein D3C76_426350 [compost metagenome]